MDTNQSDAMMCCEEPASQTPTNLSGLAMTTNSLPIQQHSLKSRDEFESSIREFSGLWPSRKQTVHPHTSIGFNDSLNRTVASCDSKNDNYSKRNGALISGGVPLAPLTLETDPNAWDLPSSTIENQNRKSNTCSMNEFTFFVRKRWMFDWLCKQVFHWPNKNTLTLLIAWQFINRLAKLKRDVIVVTAHLMKHLFVRCINFDHRKLVVNVTHAFQSKSRRPSNKQLKLNRYKNKARNRRYLYLVLGGENMQPESVTKWQHSFLFFSQLFCWMTHVRSDFFRQI